MIRFIYFLVFAAFLLPSCQRDAAVDADMPLSIRVELGISPTKVALGAEAEGNYPVLWQQGDRISLNGLLSNTLSASFSGGEEAVFSFAGASPSAPYNLLFPGAATDQINIPGDIIPMYATGSDLSGVFAFHHLGAGVKVTLTGDLQVTSLSLNAPGGENIAGVFTLDKSAGAFNGNMTPSSAASSLRIDCASPVDLSDGEPHCFYMFFAPGSFSEGLVITAEDVSGVSRSWLFASGKTLSKGYVYQLPVISFMGGNISDYAECDLEDLSEQTIEFEI